MITLENEIISLYNEFQEYKGYPPPLATIKVKWKECKPNTSVELIVIEDNLKTSYKNDDIVFYVSTLDDLLNLTKPGNCSDFTVIDILNFSDI